MKVMNVSDVQAIAAVFNFGGRELIVEADREALDTLGFWDRYGHDCHRAMGHYGLDDYGSFFVFYVEDCFDPPLYVIRADTFESAYEIFCDEFSRLIAIDDSDLSDYLHEYDCPNRGRALTEENHEDPCSCGGERLNYSSSGVAIDTEAVQGSEITLLRVICELPTK